MEEFARETSISRMWKRGGGGEVEAIGVLSRLTSAVIRTVATHVYISAILGI